MSKSNSLETSLLALIFNATPIANIADDASSGPLTQLWVSLHTADPAEGGNQASNESAYTNYARVATGRTSTSWSVSGNTASNTTAITFAECGTTGSTVTYFGIGSTSSGNGVLFYSGLLTAQLAISSGITPSFAAAALTVTED